jgi:hypothetical protein
MNSESRTTRFTPQDYAWLSVWRYRFLWSPRQSSLRTPWRKETKYKEEPEVANGNLLSSDWVKQQPAEAETTLLETAEL